MFREHLLTTADEKAWRKYLPASRSVFGSLGYARICETYRDCSPRLYVVESGEAAISYPVLFRSLANLPFATGTSSKWDVATSDFTGPLVVRAAQAESGSAGDCIPGQSELAAAFPKLRNALFQQEGVVAEFAHLHPWSQAQTVLNEGCVYNREIVWVDVTLRPEELWRNHLENSCRKNIQRADREGVRIVVASKEDHIREFFRIYRGTMERNHALRSYYFSYDFFKAFWEELPDNSRFVLAEYRDQIVAATLYLHDDVDVYSVLGGADATFQHVRPTNAVVWKTMEWAHAAGKKRLILGGGYKPDDGIFRFKSTFSRFRRPFYIYKRIHHEEDYARLEQDCRRYNGLDGEPVSYFPVYRYVGETKPMVAAHASSR